MKHYPIDKHRNAFTDYVEETPSLEGSQRLKCTVNMLVPDCWNESLVEGRADGGQRKGGLRWPVTLARGHRTLARAWRGHVLFRQGCLWPKHTDTHRGFGSLVCQAHISLGPFGDKTKCGPLRARYMGWPFYNSFSFRGSLFSRYGPVT